jgi:hypothetical protein
MDIATLRAALMEDLARHLAPVPLADLEVAEDLDHDGDPILRVRAIYDDREGDPTDDQVFEAHGVVADRLQPLGETRFPILTFISRSDRQAEAA